MSSNLESSVNKWSKSRNFQPIILMFNIKLKHKSSPIAIDFLVTIKSLIERFEASANLNIAKAFLSPFFDKYDYLFLLLYKCLDL